MLRRNVFWGLAGLVFGGVVKRLAPRVDKRNVSGSATKLRLDTAKYCKGMALLGPRCAHPQFAQLFEDKLGFSQHDLYRGDGRNVLKLFRLTPTASSGNTLTCSLEPTERFREFIAEAHKRCVAD